MKKGVDLVLMDEVKDYYNHICQSLENVQRGLTFLPESKVMEMKRNRERIKMAIMNLNEEDRSLVEYEIMITKEKGYYFQNISDSTLRRHKHKAIRNFLINLER